VSTGTAEVVEVAMASPILTPALRDGGISVYRHVVPDLFLAMTLNHSGGLSLRWFRDTFGEKEIQLAKELRTDAFNLILQNAPGGPTDLFVLPHFSGSGTPVLDTNSKGAIIGLTFGATKADVARAILEGLCFELKTNLELLRSNGISIDKMHAVGGGAKSRLWLQMKADVCDVKLKVPQITEAACLGAAILAGVGAGVYNDFSAVHELIEFEISYEPESRRREQYAQRYKMYQNIYPALKDIHHNMLGV
jgi:xylulokinase